MSFMNETYVRTNTPSQTITGNLTVDGNFTLTGPGNQFNMNYSIVMMEDQSIGGVTHQLLFGEDQSYGIYGWLNISGSGQNAVVYGGDNIYMTPATQGVSNNGSIILEGGRNAGNVTIIPGSRTDDSVGGYTMLLASDNVQTNMETGIRLYNTPIDTLGKLMCSVH